MLLKDIKHCQIDYAFVSINLKFHDTRFSYFRKITSTLIVSSIDALIFILYIKINDIGRL